MHTPIIHPPSILSHIAQLVHYNPHKTCHEHNHRAHQRRGRKEKKGEEEIEQWLRAYARHT